MDHNVPTLNRTNIDDPISAQQIETLIKNCEEFGIKLFDLASPLPGDCSCYRSGTRANQTWYDYCMW